MVKIILKVFVIFVALSAIIALRVFIFDIYKIPSVSMSPAILTGDYVLVSKISYGPRIINITKLILAKELEYIRIKGFGQAKKNDIVVFNFPQYEYLSDSVNFIYGTSLIKRCFGLPGENIIIGKKDTQRIKSWNIFPYDTSLHWSLDAYGPLYVPRSGDMIELKPKNVRHYHDVLLYENIGIQIQNDSVFFNGIHSPRYCFKYNYYFMLGDNFYQSRDSRYWGFLPETHIIGKAVLVLLSLDPEAPWYKKFRWKRFLKEIV